MAKKEHGNECSCDDCKAATAARLRAVDAKLDASAREAGLWLKRNGFKGLHESSARNLNKSGSGLNTANGVRLQSANPMRFGRKEMLPPSTAPVPLKTPKPLVAKVSGCDDRDSTARNRASGNARLGHWTDKLVAEKGFASAGMASGTVVSDKSAKRLTVFSRTKETAPRATYSVQKDGSLKGVFLFCGKPAFSDTSDAKSRKAEQEADFISRCVEARAEGKPLPKF